MDEEYTRQTLRDDAELIRRYLQNEIPYPETFTSIGIDMFRNRLMRLYREEPTHDEMILETWRIEHVMLPVLREVSIRDPRVRREYEIYLMDLSSNLAPPLDELGPNPPERFATRSDLMGGESDLEPRPTRGEHGHAHRSQLRVSTKKSGSVKLKKPGSTKLDREGLLFEHWFDTMPSSRTQMLASWKRLIAEIDEWYIMTTHPTKPHMGQDPDVEHMMRDYMLTQFVHQTARKQLAPKDVAIVSSLISQFLTKYADRQIWYD